MSLYVEKRNNMKAKTVTPTKKKLVLPPKSEYFNNPQMDLFRGLLCNTDTERDSLSNLFDLWDSIPRYVVSRQQQDKWRKSGTFPLLYEVPFHYRGRELVATIQPAAVKNSSGDIQAYFPSANEELIEDVLRKLRLTNKTAITTRKSNVAVSFSHCI